MDENLTDEQQADIVRRWLKENGTFIVAGIVIGLGGLFGWQQWQQYAANKAGRASDLYEQVVAGVGAGHMAEASALLDDLRSGFGKSPYLDQARLLMAKASLDQNDFDAAADYLGSVATGASTPEMEEIARLRLARVRLHQRDFEAALAALEPIDPNSAFAPRASVIRGDIHAAMEDFDTARAEYEAALADTRQPPVIDRQFVQAKLDNLGGRLEAPPDATATDGGA